MTDSRLSDQIYDTLRRRIVVGDIPQGSRLAEQRLAAELQVSRVPLREAIPQLEVDGFVTSIPRRGAIVSSWSTRLVHDLFDTRLALEPAAARRAATRAQEGEPFDELLRIQSESELELAAGDQLGIADANTRYHQALVDAAGNDLMSGLMRATSGRMSWLFYLTRQRDPLVACEEHRHITAAILSGNERLAEAVVYAHIENGREPSLAAMKRLLAPA
ncbi:MAG: GntR family transcriptional regulator [Microbacterium sp.]|uniref:GntR family transcriptional regulator n=1 Tax=Microbacterium sp. TaxID=51671 RepID=UPI0026326CB4|nr:GntR family transcriptional regulator [Microbacterium sp.]MDF2562023.1 GntR family transcriptional regulator [Microbacterium sp.]